MVFKKSHIHTVILTVLCAAVFVSHMFYVAKSRQYPQWDEHHYLSQAVAFYDIFHGDPVLWYSKILYTVSYRQPVYGLILSGLLLLFGTDHTYKLALLFNGVLYVATIISVYYLAKSFFDKTASLMAAMIFAFYGNALFFLHFTYSETILTTFVAATVLALWKTKDFTNPKWSLVLAIFFGLSNLVKWSAPAFVVLPCIYVGIRAMVRVVQKPKERVLISKNIALVLLVGVMLPIVFYYIPNWEPFFAYVKRNQTDSPQWVTTYRYADMVNTFSSHSLMYYFNILSQNTVYFLILFVIGVLVSIRYINKYAFLLFAFASQYGFLTFFSVWKEDRYAVSMYPFMAILSAVTIQHIRSKIVKSIVIAITVVIALFNFFGASWAVGPMGKRGLTDVVLPEFIRHPRRIYLTPLVWPPNVEFVNAHRLFELIDGNKKSRVLQLFEYEPWDNAVMSIATYEKRGMIEILKDMKQLPESDYVLTKNEELSLIANTYSIAMPNVKLLGVIYVPIDSSRVYVYQVNL